MRMSWLLLALLLVSGCRPVDSVAPEMAVTTSVPVIATVVPTDGAAGSNAHLFMNVC
jgi:hypothetical protein